MIRIPRLYGIANFVVHEVTEADLAPTLFPELRKPPVLASARLLRWAEEAAMAVIKVPCLGTDFVGKHADCAVLGARVVFQAQCIFHVLRDCTWRVVAWWSENPADPIASFTLGFRLIDMDEYTLRRVIPKQRRVQEANWEREERRALLLAQRDGIHGALDAMHH